MNSTDDCYHHKTNLCAGDILGSTDGLCVNCEISEKQQNQNCVAGEREFRASEKLPHEASGRRY